MSVVATDTPNTGTLADLLDEIGVPPSRVARRPAPGTATDSDLLALSGPGGRFELVDGVLVEKSMGVFESVVAGVLVQLIRNYLDGKRLGMVTCTDGNMRLGPSLVRAPDVGYVAWDRLPNRRAPREAIADLAPDLAIEVLSPSNTAAEMRRKLHDYFGAGTQLVWYIDPKTSTARMFTSPSDVVTIGLDGVLDGGSVLPGFQVSLREVFERADNSE